MAVSMIGPKFYAWDRNGKPLAFGKVYTYEARTNSPQVTYQSEDAVVANTNPVILNGEGYANIYLNGSYKVVVKDKDDNEIWTADPVTAQGGEEWVNCMTATYLSSTTFKISGNVTDKFEPGRRIRIDNNAATYAYSTILSAVFAATDTTITLTDAVVTTGIVNACVSIIGSQSLISEPVATIAKLREFEPSINLQEVPVNGHTISGIGGDMFWHDASDTTSADNNGTVIRTTVGDKCWKRKEKDAILAVDYGLYDGASESVCSQAIQSIIDSTEDNNNYNVDNGKTGWGCKIQFPSGRFPLANITISKFNFIFEGVGHSTYLVNQNTTGMMIDCSEASGQTLGGISLRDLHVRNTVNRSDGAGPIILMDNPVRSSLSNVLFTSSDFNVGSRVALRCDMLKTIAPFEFIASEVVFYGCDVAWEMVSDSQSDTVDLQNVVTNECAIGLLGFVGAGGSGNNNFKFSGKFIGSQGGLYVSSGNDAFAETTVVSTSSNIMIVASSTNMQVGRAVVVGTDNTVEWAIIKSIAANTLTLDRPITKAASTRVLSGRFGAILCEMRNPNFSGIQLEGLDVGILMLTGSREITIDAFLPSSTAKVFYGSSNFRRLNLLNGSGGAVGTMQNGVTFKMLTIDDGINGDSNKIYFDVIPGEGSDYYDGTLESLVDNKGVYDPQIQIESRFDGDINLGNNSRTATEYRNKSYLAFNRSTTSTFTRTVWKENGADKWFNNFSGSQGDLSYKLNGQPVSTVTMQGFNGDFTVSDGAWDSPLFRLGDYRFWVDSAGDLRIKNGTPTSDADGSVVGSQS